MSRQAEVLNQLLHRPRPVQVQGDIDDFLGNGADNDGFLLVRGNLDHLLAEVISKRIYRRAKIEACKC